MENIIELKDISIEYKMRNYSLRAIDRVDLDIVRGKVTALVGESGSGKTTVVSSLLRCISSPGEVVGGKILFYKQSDGKDAHQSAITDVLALNSKELNAYRWGDVSMVFQASQNTLNPIMKVGEQFFETAYYHGAAKTRKEYNGRILELLDFVKLDAKRVIDAYPHELSGGMKQRVMIAFSMLLDPDVIILDEPTTALDVITQYYIFELLMQINRDRGKTMILLTHDIGVVAKFADYVGVMYAGKLVEYGTVFEVFDDRLHPYTKGLIKATPSLIAPLSSVESIGGSAPNLLNLPEGCAFAPRCPYFAECCVQPQIMNVTVSGHKALCCRSEELRCF